MELNKVRSELIELRNIHLEITRLKNTLKELNIKSKLLENNIHKFLKEKDQKSISYGDFKIEATNKERRCRKKVAEKEKDTITVLQNAGIRDPKKLYTDILQSMKGEIVKETGVKKIKMITNYTDRKEK